MTGQHCGVCSQCVDRRFGILAAGLSSYDPADNYAIDLFAGAHEPGAAVTMIEGFVLRAHKLATMSQHAFVSNYGQIFRAVEKLPGSVDENVARMWDLHRRHGKDVVSVMDQELRDRVSISGALDLPPTSLVSLVLSPIALQPNYEDPVENELSSSQQAALDLTDYSPAPISIALDEKQKRAIFSGGVEIGGQGFELIQALFEAFVSDLEVGTFADEHRYLKAAALARQFSIDEPSLRKRIWRVRKQLVKQFLKIHNRQLSNDDVIENKEWTGYRLNPYLLLAKPAQLLGRGLKVSHLSGPLVTSRDSSH